MSGITSDPTVYYLPFRIGFMDDVSLRGRAFTVSSDVDLFRREEAKIGLQLNIAKYDAISEAPFNPAGLLAGFSTTLPSNAILLGASLVGLGSAIDRPLEVTCSNLRKTITRLKSICTHDTLILLRSSISVPDFYTSSEEHHVIFVIS